MTKMDIEFKRIKKEKFIDTIRMDMKLLLIKMVIQKLLISMVILSKKICMVQLLFMMKTDIS